MGQTRQRCWKLAWVIDLDIKGFFDNIDHDLLMRAVKKHAKDKWMVLYIERWLQAPAQAEDGHLTARGQGTPQGGGATPPTKLQTFFSRVGIRRMLVDPKHDIDLVLCHFDPLHQSTNQLAFARPVRGRESVVDLGSKVL